MSRVRTPFLLLLAGALSAPVSLAHTEAESHGARAPRPDTHAPAGVMFEHMHRAGEWMIGYRYQYSRQDGLFQGSDEISRAELMAAGYSGIPREMTMHMHMLDLMYAPTDWLNLMLMPQYMEMDMSMQMVMDMDAGGEHGGHGGGHAPGRHEHGSSGLGDTVLAALLRLYGEGDHQIHAGLGFSAPTGDVDRKNPDGTMVHYGMQLGSGTWDFLPTLTYSGRHQALTWGAQLGGVFRLESKNKRGFSFGDQYRATGWTAYRVLEWASLSLRVQYSKEEDIQGHYDRPHNHGSPADLQVNYGGEFWDLGIGVNTVVTGGALAGHRLGIEWLEPVAEHYHGYQLGRDGTLAVSWSLAF